MTNLPVIHGEKGGSSKQRTPVEAPNTLRSVSKGRILDLIAHGPIVGLAEGLKSVYLDDTPLQNPDGSFNFEGVAVTTREGYPDQTYIPGFRAVENPVSVSAEVTYDTPIVRALSNTDADAVQVVIQVGSLVKQNPSTGDTNGHSVTVAVDVKLGDGAWSNRITDTISGKTTSPYQRTYRIDLATSGLWEVRVRRISPDDPNSSSQSKTSWVSMTEIVDSRLSYPDSALVGIEVDAQLFGNQMPSRSYDMKLSIISVPSNYDPETRAYTGIWDGTFKQAWTDNPAWIYYDLATHPVIGAGLINVDKWALYAIGKYCDELVPDGYGGLEPRFTVNTLFAEREEAITTLTTLAGAFRGMTYWGTDTVVPVADMPADPKKLVGPANVVNGEFEDSGTSMKERHSVAIVMWNDPEDSFKAKPEFVEDPDSIDLFGWKETQVTAFGCSSRGQAHRLGQWILYSERMETQTVSYSAVADQADLRPGDIIEISDPDRAGARLAGRVKGPGLTELTLDKVPTEVAGYTWYLSVMMPSGSIERRQVASFIGDKATLADPLSAQPVAGAMWILSSTAVVPPQYRVVSVAEQSDGTYQITATEYDPNKYAIVEMGLKLPETSHSLIPTGTLAPPMSLTAETYTYLAGGTEHQGLTISWTHSDDPRTSGYVLEVWGPTDVKWRTIFSGNGTSVDEKDAAPGEWMIRLKAVQALGAGSAWVTLTTQIAGLLLPVPPDSVDVEVATFSITLRPRGHYPGAMYEFWRSSVALTDNLIESNAVRLSVSTDLADVGLRSNTTYFYYVRGANAYGVSGWYPVQATTLEQFDDILAAVDSDIRKPGGLFEQMVDEVQSTALTDLETARAEITLLDGQVDNLTAGVHNLELMNELESVRHLATIALHEGNSARATTEEATRVDEDSALSTRITTLQSAFDTNSASVSTSLATLATADQSLTQQVSSAQSTADSKNRTFYQAAAPNSDMAAGDLWFDTDDGNKAYRYSGTAWVATDDTRIAANTAAISTEATTRADADSALSQQITSLSSSTNDQFASLSTTYSTISYTDGAVARAVTKATVNGKDAVFGISTDGVVSEIGAVADRFYVYNPIAGDYTLAFAVEDGKSIIREAMINKLTFTKLRDETGALVFENGKLKADYIDATTLVVGVDNVTGLGALAVEDALSYLQITGTKPPVDATKGADSSNLQAGIGSNLLPNSDLSLSIGQWRLGWDQSGQGGFTIARDLAAPDWCPIGSHTAGIGRSGTPTGVWDLLNDVNITVIPGKRYEVSGRLASHRCQAALLIVFYNASGATVGETQTAYTALSGGKDLSNYAQHLMFVTAPAGAAYAQFRVRSNATGEANPYTWVTQPMVCLAGEGQTTASPWSASNYVEQITSTNVNALIGTAAIGAAHIGSLALVGNFSVKSGLTGQRVEMDANGGRVYDSNNVLRVRWGVW